MHLFFGEISGSTALLTPEESHHATRVLRLDPGSQIGVLNNSGNLYRCRIISASKNQVAAQVEAIEENYGAVSPYVHIAIAPTKTNDRIEFFLEKAVEIGVSRITPLLTENSERKKINHSRWINVVKAAAKQSHKGKLPVLDELTAFAEFLRNVPQAGAAVGMAHCASGAKKSVSQIISGQKSVLIMIGPEGDFSEREIKQAREKNIDEITLSPHRLRTETAGIVAVTQAMTV